MRLHIMQFRVAVRQIARLYRIQPQKTQVPEKNILHDQSTMPLPPFAPSHVLSRIPTIDPCLSCKRRRFCSTRLYTLAEKFELLDVVRSLAMSSTMMQTFPNLHPVFDQGIGTFDKTCTLFPAQYEYTRLELGSFVERYEKIYVWFASELEAPATLTCTPPV